MTCSGQTAEFAGKQRRVEKDALAEVVARGYDALAVDADPHAEAFYLACGARRVGAVAAPIAGQPSRVRPQLVLVKGATRAAGAGNGLVSARLERPALEPPSVRMPTLAFLDVDYRGSAARAACVMAQCWQAESPLSTHACDIESVQPYRPGEFYRRELPCLLAVLAMFPAVPELVVIDGYVRLPPSSRAGLGAHLHAALGEKTPVVGIAKSAFAGVQSCSDVVPVVRGASKRPLFITAVGVEPALAAASVRAMAGKHRIPELLELADRLSRGVASIA